MTHTFQATYDGECLHPAGPLPVPPDTELTLSFEDGEERKPAMGRSIIDIALASTIEGPPDWSERVDHYLYGAMVDEEG